MSLIDNFLNTYKKLETILRNSKQRLKITDYEQLISEDRNNKLRLCRNVRNFLQHEFNGEEFIVPTQKMIDFLEDEIRFLKGQKIAKEKETINTVQTLPSSITLGEVAKILSSGKRIWYPVIDGENRPIGQVDYDIYEYLVQVQNKSLSIPIGKLLPSKPNIPIVHEETKKQYERAILVNKSGEYRGILER